MNILRGFYLLEYEVLAVLPYPFQEIPFFGLLWNVIHYTSKMMKSFEQSLTFK